MAELNANDVDNYTHGAMSAVDPETQRLLDAALAAARRWCGWHVCPVRTDEEIVLNGPGTLDLQLPTLKLIEVTDIIELDLQVDLDWISVDAVTAALFKQPGYPLDSSWFGPYGNIGWCSEPSGIVVTMTHGYTEAEAADWRNGVLAAVSRMGEMAGSEGLAEKRVDDVYYRWGGTDVSQFLNKQMLAPYKLEIVV